MENVALDGLHIDCKLLKAQCCVNMQLLNEAVSLCNEVFELQNDCMEAVKYRGKAYLLSGLYDSVRYYHNHYCNHRSKDVCFVLNGVDYDG